MDDIAIQVENLSKAYQLGDFSTGTLSRDLERWWALMRGKEDPFLKIGEANDRAIKGTSDIVWSLKDINFEIKQGEAVGIIGKNGAGKSTLLKLLSRVTSPTSGTIKVKGRIASLLEVGTGFHPELTGRENIFLNGAILGMRTKEITRKFDEIVDFSGVERYIDTPVKRYSSGMYVRLAFAVAAYLESEILVVDEVLAVGDAEFQKKCLGKMGEISKGEGRTVLFVSHNMGAVSQLCNKGILLNNGIVLDSGNAEHVISTYMEAKKKYSEVTVVNNITKPIQALNMRLFNEKGEAASTIKSSSKFFIEFSVKRTNNELGVVCSLEFKDKLERKIFTEQVELDDCFGITTFLLEIPANLFRPNYIYVTAVIHVPNIRMIEEDLVISFEVMDSGSKFSMYGNVDNGIIFSGAVIKKIAVKDIKTNMC